MTYVEPGRFRVIPDARLQPGQVILISTPETGPQHWVAAKFTEPTTGGNQMKPKDVCLQCGETRETVKANNWICGIMSGGESPELMHDWPRHHWADWTNTELARWGILPEFFDQYRRTPENEFQFATCAHLGKTHVHNTDGDDTLPPEYVCLRCWTDTRENP